MTEINILAVLSATISCFFIGGLWFGVIIEKPYQIAIGKQDLPGQKPSILFILAPTICNFVIILASAMLINGLGIQNISGAVFFGLTIAIGYLIPMSLMIAINPNFPRPFFYTIINAPYFLMASILSCVILIMFQQTS